ncbi:MAG: hypothetical protein NWR03_07970 [Akkermansiaceae bacterium]|nr:hypothetical protein [Akkermansiaceae bacterium]MDP4780535.1 hypothetical protein [Akkermansiaceae bacterium]MDP4897695.1 hypothetical protein [Akkermansiaceae bacterium]
MKLHVSPSVVLLLSMCCALPASAQLIEGPLEKSAATEKPEGVYSAEKPSFAADKALSGVLQLPAVRKSNGDLSESKPVFVNQDALTLSTRTSTAKSTKNVLDLSVLEETSAYRNANRIKVKVSDEQASGISAGLAELSAAYQKPSEDSADCESVAMSVGHRVEVDPSKVLEIVESEISANPNCSCEVVKTAIITSSADPELVGDIAEVAIMANPDAMRMISQCAIAALPEALPNVQSVLAKLDPNRGDGSYSAKDSKSGKDAVAGEVADMKPPEEPPNPLDKPFISFPPPPPNPPVTNPDPRTR